MTQKTSPDVKGFHAGFVALVGAPNAGKSTLLNRMLGTKISITSRKPQTTRNRILGVVHRPTAQLVFIDTPGVHQAKLPLNIRIVDTALSALGDVDLVLMLADSVRPDRDAEAFLLNRLKASGKPVILAVNKIDQISADRLIQKLEKWSKRMDFKHIVPISALHGSQVENLLQLMEDLLPEGPPFYGEDMLTDSAERFIVAEMIREKVFRLTGEEIPYATAVTVDVFKDTRQGKMVAREDIEKLLGVKVYLELFVRVQKHWTRDTRALRKFGY